MSTYRVRLMTTAEAEVEVEAGSPEEAIDLALNGDLPYAPGFASYSFGEWGTPSDLFPTNDPSHDVELVE